MDNVTKDYLISLHLTLMLLVEILLVCVVVVAYLGYILGAGLTGTLATTVCVCAGLVIIFFLACAWKYCQILADELANSENYTINKVGQRVWKK